MKSVQEHYEEVRHVRQSCGNNIQVTAKHDIDSLPVMKIFANLFYYCLLQVSDLIFLQILKN
jgi:hypothetical protein